MNVNSVRRDRFYLAHIGFIAAAVAFRVFLSLNLGIIGYPDTETYELFALEALTNSPASLPVRPLGYPIFLTWVYKALGPDRSYVIYVQHLLGAFSYLLYYPIFLSLTKRRLFSAVLSFAATLESVIIVYERAILSDFLNHFFILLAVFILFRYLSTRRTYLAVLLGGAAFAAGIIRPTSVILTSLIIVFLALNILGALIRKGGRGRGEGEEGRGGRGGRGGWRGWAKGLSAFVLTFVILNALFYVYSVKRVGFRGEPVGILGLTMLVRTADLIDYGGGSHTGVKAEYRGLRDSFYGRYERGAADHIGGYVLMTRIQCLMDPVTARTYREAAMSAEKFYGAHEVGRRYFTIYDVLREMRCDVSTVDAIFLDIAKEAAVSNSFSYAVSVLKSAFAFIRAKPMEYQDIHRDKGPIPALVRLHFPLDNLLASRAVSAFLTALFVLGGAAYFTFPDKPAGGGGGGWGGGGGGGVMEAAFLTSFVALNYLSISMMLDGADAIVRYKISSSPLQLALLSLFIYNLIMLLSDRLKARGR